MTTPASNVTRKFMIALLALVLVGSAAACGDDGGSDLDGLAGDLQSAAADDGEDLTDDQANCLADALVVMLGEDEAEEAAAGGVEGIEEAMTAFTTSMMSDPEEAERIAAGLSELDESCLDEMGIDPADLDLATEG